MSYKNIYVQNIQPANRIEETFLVTEKNLVLSQKGSLYLSLRLRDKTGEVEGRVWERAAEISRTFQKGDVVLVRGRAVRYRDAIQLSIADMEKPDPADIDMTDYVSASRWNVDDMFKSLVEIAATVEDPFLKQLLDGVLADEEIAGLLKKAPAAKGMHHFYLGGLLEHTLSMTRILNHLAEHYDGVNRDLLITGGIFHDIGKIYELSSEGMIEYTDEGRLIGHIVLGLELVNRKMSLIPGFPEHLAMELRHILISHHGAVEYGSPKRPKTLEALMVYFADDLDAKVNAFQESISGTGEDESSWTPYHRLFDRYIYKGPKPK